MKLTTLLQPINDYRLGRIIRKEGISVMLLQLMHRDKPTWAACNAVINENLGHCGKWGEGRDPLSVAISVKQQS